MKPRHRGRLGLLRTKVPGGVGETEAVAADMGGMGLAVCTGSSMASGESAQVANLQLADRKAEPASNPMTELGEWNAIVRLVGIGRGCTGASAACSRGRGVGYCAAS